MYMFTFLAMHSKVGLINNVMTYILCTTLVVSSAMHTARTRYERSKTRSSIHTLEY